MRQNIIKGVLLNKTGNVTCAWTYSRFGMSCSQSISFNQAIIKIRLKMEIPEMLNSNYWR
ncbi:hypothetical protein F1649_17965 [Arcticibacter tournemirensis]|uniref:Uncharacterized protein n=1 Tax=Arcticibacter tournemirensis TaxID=699437 RepID=A0A5M9GU14_9SPHI|nr:hypothetical protein [Arcticibacter tournemirensis]KAA8478223.1 hypothetical protein F1649_17965 [Arcticibacter tournemirensis]